MKYSFSILLLLHIFFSCGPRKIKPKNPVLTRTFESIINEMHTIGDFNTATITYSTKQYEDDTQITQLELYLFNGTRLPYTENGLDSLAKKAASILKKSIANFNEYGWITVMFKKDNPEDIQPDLKSVYVYRPAEIK